MSLIPRQVAPVLARLEHKPLPNATQLIVIGGDLNITTRGHTFGDFTISTAGSTGTHIGDHIEMGKSRRYPFIPFLRPRRCVSHFGLTG